MLKVCYVCNEEKPIEEFARKKDAYQSKCKACQQVYHKQYYDNNKERYFRRIRKNQHRIRDEIRTYKISHGCRECGETHPACLDLHHREREQKAVQPADIHRRGWSRERVQEELDKCDVLCSNCHRKLHWDEKEGLRG